MSKTLPNDIRPRQAQASPLVSLADVASWRDTRPFALLQISRFAEQRPEDIIESPLPLVRLSLTDLSGVETPTSGRQPLPEHRDLVETLTSAGLSADTTLVIFADTAKDLGAAARAWVTLRWAGAHTVRFLNGVFREDIRAALLANPSPLRSAPRALDRHGSLGATFVVDPTVTIDADAIAATRDTIDLVDARTADVFNGVDATGRAEHIPGATNVPSVTVSEHGAISGSEQVSAVFAPHVVGQQTEKDVVVYCGSGVSASVDALALASIGVTARVYVGSWSEWSKRPR